jgi:hypothetical protein
MLGRLTEGMPQRFEDTVLSLDRRLVANHGLHSDCDSSFTESPNCYTSPTPTMLVWGDSYAMHLVQGLLASESGLNLQQHTMPGCSPLLGLSQLPPSKRSNWAARCIKFNDDVLDWLKRTPSVKTVVLSSPYMGVLENPLYTRGGKLVQQSAMEAVRQSMLATAETIRQSGAKVVIVSPPPVSGWDIGHCLEQSVFQGLDTERTCAFPLDDTSEASRLLRLVSQDVPVYWLQDDVCTSGTCQASRDGVLLYRDNGHLTIEGSSSLGKRSDWTQRFSAMAD